ncbi:uncharacterized protein G2W53_014293 [Senna tora]|uniref:Uncharacterized protein n=1 Tax=Senna tora TaxID=362788 RepID=A0A835C5I2_9FABA|nr:uncharacterized protein G2W53_014293 [Senna tora]
MVLILQLQSSWHGRSVDHVLTYSGRQIAVGSQKPSRITRQKTCCASESKTSNRVVFANRTSFDAPIGVVLAWEERGSCLNIFRMVNRGRISETFTNYEAKDSLRNAGGSQKPTRITRQKFCCASESNTSVRVVFANRSGFDAPIGVVLAWEERGSCLNIFRTKNRGGISENFTNYEAKDLLRNAGGSQKPSRITRQKFCCASESNTSVRVVFANRSGFDAPIGVVLAWEECGSCLNIFRTTNRRWISKTFTNYEAKDLLRKSVDHVLTYSGRKIAVGSQKPSRITRQKTVCASESKTSSVHVVFANRSGFDAPIGVVLAWEERKRLVAQVSQTRQFALYLRTGVVLKLQLESSWHGWSVDHVLTNSGRRIAVGPLKTSRITRQKTCCAIVMAWEELGSCLNIFQMTNRGRISETFTNYEAKDLLRRPKTCCACESKMSSVRVVFANQSGFDAPIGVVLAREKRGSCLNVFRTTNRARISETFMHYEAKDILSKSVDHVLTYSGRQIAVGSQKPSRITRQRTCCASESNTPVRVVFANRSGFGASIGVFLAWEKRGSCLSIFRTRNHDRISETFTNYEAKDLLRK